VIYSLLFTAGNTSISTDERIAAERYILPDRLIE
jgi:hypothetical protein